MTVQMPLNPDNLPERLGKIIPTTTQTLQLFEPVLQFFSKPMGYAPTEQDYHAVLLNKTNTQALLACLPTRHNLPNAIQFYLMLETLTDQNGQTKSQRAYLYLDAGLLSVKWDYLNDFAFLDTDTTVYDFQVELSPMGVATMTLSPSAIQALDIQLTDFINGKRLINGQRTETDNPFAYHQAFFKVSTLQDVRQAVWDSYKRLPLMQKFITPTELSHITYNLFNNTAIGLSDTVLGNFLVELHLQGKISNATTADNIYNIQAGFAFLIQAGISPQLFTVNPDYNITTKWTACATQYESKYLPFAVFAERYHAVKNHCDSLNLLPKFVD